MSVYRYSPLKRRIGANSIRLLRLLPNEDENAMIECQLFEYFFPDPDTGTHLYEALSYVWGDPQTNRSRILLSNCPFGVTANLHAALSRLRNRYIERVIWIDAICINQDDLEERGYQIQCMARIFGKAKCVIAWLGESAVGSDRAIEDLGIAADKSLATPPMTAELRDNVLGLIQRPWFRRIWILQEVAAARQILITCGRAQIDGYTFCVGLQRFNFPYKEFATSQSLIRLVAILINQAIFRPRSTIWWSGRTSLKTGSLVELLDMYHAHEATERHDKVFALLGMSCDDPIAAGLSPDYEVPWAKVFMNLVLSIFGKTLSIKTLGNGEVAVIEA
ncbi:HET-domain-containing protein [Lophium mytilinum]|uniref:HET-domain-containing protein n=1 Tax=Lophium mytilinum TaxID=390894 RepID=A0A6A6QTG9_9PEZI|nr:HET-domain-containing protein [Lophium mytilinum]